MARPAAKPRTFDFDPESAIRHLSRRDAALRRVIREAGPFSLQLEPDPFRMLVRSILSQQISTTVARAIRERLEGLVAPRKLSPANLAALSIEQMTSIGVSRQKASYLHDLAARAASRTPDLKALFQHPDDEVIEQLVAVKGIGVWTAKMFLIFSAGRADVLPHEDLGIRMGIRNIYQLEELPDRAACEDIAACWRPYASVASWYCWRSLDLKKAAEKSAKLKG